MRYLKIISGMALATMLALGTHNLVLAQSGQEHQGKEQQPLEGVWDISITIRSCTTGSALATGRAIQIFIDGGTMTEIADRSNRSPGLGTWHHLGGRSYATHHKFIEYSAAGSFNGTTVLTREIELSANADDFTAATTTEVFNAAGQLINTVCTTSTATRFE
jgi:hypothetical protein